MTSHDELVAEMASLERMSVQDRLKLARKRRAAQLKRWTASDKEFIKKSRKSGIGRFDNVKKGRRIHFAHNIQLLEAAARGDIDEVRSLLESGVNPNIGNEDGLTALHQCCIDNNEAMMKLLVEHGADVNVTDRELWTPLHASSTCGHVNLARFLVDNGAELLAINSDGNMPYDICEDEMTLDYIESQMADKGITQEHIDELRDVAPNRMLNDLVKLKQSNQDLEKRDEIGASFLHIAAANGFDKVAKFLLDNNVDVNAKDDDGWQPIHAAACWAHGEMIQLLVGYGADLDAKTNNSETPLTICEDDDLKTLINQLKAELHAHRSLESKLVRRNSSRNKRSSSIRRSSKREKGEMRKLDAKGEAMFIQSQNSTDELPATNIDEVKVDLDEPHNPLLVTSPSEEVELDIEDAVEINGALETDIIPLAVITEETPESPVRKSRLENGDKNASVRQNGADGEKGLGVAGFQRQPKSILKKRHDQEEPEDLHSKKSKRDKKEADTRKQQLEMEKQREREERERIKQQEKEERQKEKEEREREKQRLREEKKQQQKREREEREREKQLKRKTITDDNVAKKEIVAKKENNQVVEVDDSDKNHSGGKDTLAELKRQRASEHSKRTHSGESNEEFDSAWSDPSGRKNSFDILKDHKNSTKQKKSPHITRKLLPHRPASGSYSFAETSANDGQRDSVASEQNGVSDGGLNSSESKSLNDSFPGDPPLKRFTATEPEVIGGDEDQRCCVIL